MKANLPSLSKMTVKCDLKAPSISRWTRATLKPNCKEKVLVAGVILCVVRRPFLFLSSTDAYRKGCARDFLTMRKTFDCSLSGLVTFDVS